MKKNPGQVVKEKFGTKHDLAKLLYTKLERPFDDESQEDFERRIRTTSAKKLLRLHENLEIVEKEFGNKSGLVDAIMKAKYAAGKPDLQYRAKLESYRTTRLLDIYGAC